MRIKGKLPWSIESPSIHLVQPNERAPLVHEVVSRQPSLSEDDTILFTLADQEWKLPKTLKKQESVKDKEKNYVIRQENCALKCGYISPAIFPEIQQHTNVKRNAFFDLGTSSRSSSSSSSNEVICEKTINSLGRRTQFTLCEESVRNKPNFDEIIQELKNDSRKNSEGSELSVVSRNVSRNNSLDVNNPTFCYVDVDLHYRRNDDRKKPVRKSFSEETFDKNKIQNLQERNAALKNCTKRERTVSRTSSCDEWCEEMWNKMNPNDKRRVSQMVDELLTEIYGLSVRSRKKVGVSSCGRLSSSTLEDIDVFSEHDDGKSLSKQWRRKTLERKDITELKELLSTLKAEIKRFGSRLVRHLKRRDCYKAAREWHCNWLTAYLQANSEKRSEDTHTRFSLSPSPGESGFAQWQNGMRMVARLPEGIPAQFRKTLWLTLAEKHLASHNVNWQEVEEFCFNEFTNPDDEELGVQIVKDVHRTGCSLFCGVSGQHNQALLKRVLLAYARWNKSVGYCQGFNMLAALILQVMDKSEVDSVKVMIYLIEGVLPESYFANNLRGLSVDMAVFRDLLRIKLPSLSRHLEQLQCDSKESGTSYEPPLTNVFTMQWFLTLFCNCLPQDTVLRVWDLIFLEGNHILLKTALAIWNTLSDRILSVESADEFYSIMGVLTREMLEFGLMDANTLIKAIVSINLPEVSEMRERYLYNITPWTLSVTTVARKGLRLFYSDDDTDTEEDEKIAVANAYGLFRSPKKKDAISNLESMSHRAQNSVSGHSERIMDIATLKKQYCKLRERQRQAHIILAAACGGQSLVGPTSSPAMNHLLLGKRALVNNRGRRLGPPPGAVPPPHRTKESATDYLKKVHDGVDLSQKDSRAPYHGETLHWKDMTGSAEKNRRKTSDVSKSMEQVLSPVSPQSSRRDSSSSTSTELCDDPQLSDSEDKTSSLNECSVVSDSICGGIGDTKVRESGDLNVMSEPDLLSTDKEDLQKLSENITEDNTLKSYSDAVNHTKSTELPNFKIDPEEIKELDRKLSLKIEEIEREKRRKSFNNLENQELIDSMVLFPFDRDYIRDNEVIQEDTMEGIKEQELFCTENKDTKDTSLLSDVSCNIVLQNEDRAVSYASVNHCDKINIDNCELTASKSDITESREFKDIVDYKWCKTNFINTKEETVRIDNSESEHEKHEYRMKYESSLHHHVDHLQSKNIFHQLYDEALVTDEGSGTLQCTSDKNQHTLETKCLINDNIIPALQHLQKSDNEHATDDLLIKTRSVSYVFDDEPDLPQKKTKSTSRRGSEVALNLILEENSQILSKFHQKSKKISSTSSDKWHGYSKDFSMDTKKVIKQYKLHSSLLKSATERITDQVTDDKERSSVRLSEEVIKDIIPGTSKTEDITEVAEKLNCSTLSETRNNKCFGKNNVENTLLHNFESIGSFKKKTADQNDENTENFIKDSSPVYVPTKQYIHLFQKDDVNTDSKNYKYPSESMILNDGYDINSSNVDVRDKFSFSKDRLSAICSLSEDVDTTSYLSPSESGSKDEVKAGVSRDASNEGVTRISKYSYLEENRFSRKQLTKTRPEYFSNSSENIFNKPDLKKYSYDLELSLGKESVISKIESENPNTENSNDTDESYSQNQLKHSAQQTDFSSMLREPVFDSEQKLGCFFSSSHKNNDDTKTCVSSSKFDSTHVKTETQDRLKLSTGFGCRSESACRNSVNNDTDTSHTPTSPTVFNPFPSRVSTRPPKELGVKLGLYLPSKTCKLPNNNST